MKYIFLMFIMCNLFFCNQTNYKLKFWGMHVADCNYNIADTAIYNTDAIKINYTVKTTSGRPTQYYFEKTINPTLYLYPAADAAYTVVYYAMLRMKDSGSYTNNNEIPFSFLPCLTAGLAYYLALKYAPDRTQVLKLVYEEEFKRAADTNRGNVSSHFVPYIGITGGTY